MPRTKYVKRLAGLLIIVLSSTGCSPTSKVETTTEQTGTETTTTTIAPTTTVAPTTTTIALTTTVAPTTTTIAPPEAVEIEPIVLEDYLAANLSDRSTPLGTLCWAIWEWGRIHILHSATRMAEQIPGLEVVLPANLDPDYTILNALEEITKPEIVGIVNDPRLSEELQLYAKGLFEDFGSMVEQTEAVGYDKVDHTKFPYPDFDHLPHADAFDKAILAHPNECEDPVAATPED